MYSPSLSGLSALLCRKKLLITSLPKKPIGKTMEIIIIIDAEADITFLLFGFIFFYLFFIFLVFISYEKGNKFNNYFYNIRYKKHK